LEIAWPLMISYLSLAENPMFIAKYRFRSL
jgi:hypothetical protein